MMSPTNVFLRLIISLSFLDSKVSCLQKDGPENDFHDKHKLELNTAMFPNIT